QARALAGFVGEMHAHEEGIAAGVGELRAVENVAAVRGKQPGDRAHDAAPVRASQREDVFRRLRLLHAAASAAAARRMRKNTGIEATSSTSPQSSASRPAP